MKRKPKVLVCNPGTLHSFRLARELKRQGIEIIFATSLFVPQMLFRLLPNKWKEKLANRADQELDGHVVQYPIPEFICLLLARLFPAKSNSLIRWRNRLFSRWVVKNHLAEVAVVWSFDTASEHIFRVAKYRGISCVLDMSTAHPSAGVDILQQHVTRCPRFWEDIDRPEKKIDELRSRDNELLLADVVVSASRFTASSIQQYSQTQATIEVIPYGVELVQFHSRKVREASSELLTFLFVGWFGPQKGVYDLLVAWKHSALEGKANLLLVGGNREDLRCWKDDLPINVKCVGRVPRGEIGDLFNSADVFVFPSLFEGFGLVILEAMASGLPVLTTKNTAGPDLIEDGVEGFISIPGDVQTLEKHILLLSEDHSLVELMGRQARKKAEKYTWGAYGKKCSQICQDLCS